MKRKVEGEEWWEEWGERETVGDKKVGWERKGEREAVRSLRWRRARSVRKRGGEKRKSSSLWDLTEGKNTSLSMKHPCIYISSIHIYIFCKSRIQLMADFQIITELIKAKWKAMHSFDQCNTSPYSTIRCRVSFFNKNTFCLFVLLDCLYHLFFVISYTQHFLLCLLSHWKGLNVKHMGREVFRFIYLFI